jgi:predicted ATP-grasp superfamily ATP-dependent carboligase
MALYRFSGSVDDLVAPVVVAAFDGWIDAAGAATTCANHIVRDAETIVMFDGDALIDYRARRPVLDVLDGTLTNIAWPDLRIHRTRTEGRDLLVMVGPEPDFRWRELGTSVLDIAHRLGVVEWVSLGAIPAAVAHTRPVPVFSTSSKPGLLSADEQQGPQGLLRVPSAALSSIEIAMSEGGVPAVGFYAQVPHYVGGPYAAAAIALLEHLQRHLGVQLTMGDLSDEANAQRSRLDTAVAADEESQEYVRRLEAMADEERIPSGDEIASEIERFLRREAGGEGPGSFEER